MKRQTVQGTCAILAATAFWGSTFVFIKDAVATIEPLNFITVRFSLAAVIMACLYPRRLQTIASALVPGNLLLALLLASTVSFQTLGLQFISASTAAFITGLSVFMVPLLQWLIDRKTPTFGIGLSCLLAVVGLFVLTGGIDTVPGWGHALVLLCAVCFGGYLYVAARVAHKTDTVQLVVVQFAVTAVMTAALSFLLETPQLPATTNVWGALLFCAVIASALGVYLQLRWQKHVPAEKSAVLFALEPLFASVAGVFYLSEPVTLELVVGGSLIIAGSIFAATLRTERPPRRGMDDDGHSPLAPERCSGGRLAAFGAPER
jgi:drug/metabolite transporter (DMT)-like permease